MAYGDYACPSGATARSLRKTDFFRLGGRAVKLKKTIKYEKDDNIDNVHCGNRNVQLV